jgi:predicted glycosyltransferase involved in capsule biosynthesis
MESKSNIFDYTNSETDHLTCTTCTTFKTDLTDVTFLIPLRIDSIERKENTDALIRYIFKYFDTSLIVLESDSVRKYFPEDNKKSFRYEFMEDSNEFFYKTKYISRLINLAETNYVAIWDADVIVPFGQILKSVDILRKEQAFLILPYDGRAYLTDKYFAGLFKETGDIDIFMKLLQAMPLMYGYHSTGGAFITSKEKYLAAGGENEKFFGWGPEDAERLKRLEIMNLTTHNTKGPLFHLWHPRGKTSWYSNKKTEIQNRRAFIETCKRNGFK